MTITSLSNLSRAASGYSHWSHRRVALSMYSARKRFPCSKRRKAAAAARTFHFGFVQSKRRFKSIVGFCFCSSVRWSDFMCVLPGFPAQINT